MGVTIRARRFQGTALVAAASFKMPRVAPNAPGSRGASTRSSGGSSSGERGIADRRGKGRAMPTVHEKSLEVRTSERQVQYARASIERAEKSLSERSSAPTAAKRKVQISRSKTVHMSLVEQEREKARINNPDAAETAFDNAALAAALRENEMLHSILEENPQKLLDERERIEIAGIFARHAQARTSVGAVNWSSRLSRRLYVLRHRVWYVATLKLSLFVLMLVAGAEPTSTINRPSPPSGWALCSVVELTCALLFFVDLCIMLVCWHKRCERVAHAVHRLHTLSRAHGAWVCAWLRGVRTPTDAVRARRASQLHRRLEESGVRCSRPRRPH
jgi:hypothetical protein